MLPKPEEAANAAVQGTGRSWVRPPAPAPPGQGPSLTAAFGKGIPPHRPLSRGGPRGGCRGRSSPRRLQGLRGSALVRAECVPGALGEGESRRAVGSELPGSGPPLPGGEAAMRRALLLRGKPMVDWCCGLLLAMAAAGGVRSAGGRTTPVRRGDPRPRGSRPPPPPSPPRPALRPPQPRPTPPLLISPPPQSPLPLPTHPRLPIPAPHAPPRCPSVRRPPPKPLPPTLSRQLSPGSALPATRLSWPRPRLPVGCAARRHRQSQSPAPSAAAGGGSRCRAANRRGRARPAGRCRARRARRTGSCSRPGSVPPPRSQCPLLPRPPPPLPMPPSCLPNTPSPPSRLPSTSLAAGREPWLSAPSPPKRGEGAPGRSRAPLRLRDSPLFRSHPPRHCL